MDVGAIQAAAAATTASYRSFADATRSVLDLLERHLPDATLFLAHLDRSHNVHRIVDTRAGESFGLRANQATPLRDSFCGRMAEDLGPRRCDDLRADAVYARLDAAAAARRRAPTSASRSSSPTARGSAASPRSRARRRASPTPTSSCSACSPACSPPSSSARARRRDLQRIQRHAARARPRARRARPRDEGALRRATTPAPPSAEAACEVTAAPVAFLLEPSGREFVSTAMVGVDIAPVTIQPRAASREYGSRAFTSRQSYFVADARTHPALAAPLVEATGARSALFEPVLRGEQIAGVLILIWRHAVEALPDAVADMLSLLAAQAAVAIEHAELRSRVGALALSDPLTGLGTRRMWDDELPRELARARRSRVARSRSRCSTSTT